MKALLFSDEDIKLQNYTEKDEKEIDGFIEYLSYLPYSYCSLANLY